MNAQILKKRTFRFSIDVINLVEEMPKTNAANIVSNQLLRSATSVGSNYRASTRARSDKEFISKINIVQEESDESLFWLEVIEEKKWINSPDLPKLLKEADELTAIFTSTLKTINKRMS
jgi:four helix bundle protein